MLKRVAVLQSNYIPWKGYFDLIASVDEFIFYDDVQYTKNDWRNRNMIKTPQGVQWLSIPVGASISRLIREVEIADPAAGSRHWARLVANYGRARHFAEVAAWLAPLYLESPWRRLSDVNQRLVNAICEAIGIRTLRRSSSDYRLEGGRSARLVSLCRQAGASVYVSGPAARSYLDVGEFDAAGITVEWFDYQSYPEYPQLWGPFVHQVSMVDLLFNCGAQAPRYMNRVVP